MIMHARLPFHVPAYLNQQHDDDDDDIIYDDDD